MDGDRAVRLAWERRVNLMRFALSILHHGADAEDAVALAMMKVYQQAASLREESKANAWLMRIVSRCCYDILRKRKREIPTEEMPRQGVLQAPTDSIFGHICELPENYRQVLVLYYYEGFGIREISGILEKNTGTVGVLLSRGREKLKAILQAEEEGYYGQQSF